MYGRKISRCNTNSDKLQGAVRNFQIIFSGEIKSSLNNNWEKVISNKCKYYNIPQSCCVVDYTNRKSKGTKLSFYPVHSGSSAIEKRRRTDWLKKIDRKYLNDKTAWSSSSVRRVTWLFNFLISLWIEGKKPRTFISEVSPQLTVDSDNQIYLRKKYLQGKSQPYEVSLA